MFTPLSALADISTPTLLCPPLNHGAGTKISLPDSSCFHLCPSYI